MLRSAHWDLCAKIHRERMAADDCERRGEHSGTQQAGCPKPAKELRRRSVSPEKECRR